MKKLVALTALTGVLAATGASAYQNGFHAGANVAYVSTTAKQQVNGTTPKGYSFSDQSPALLLEGNYGVLECGTYKAVDLRLGWIFSNMKNKEGARLKQGLTSAIGLRLGTSVSDKTIVFGRLAIDANHRKFSYPFNGQNRSDKFFDYAFAPGVGVMWDLSETMSVDILYQYAMTFATRGYNGEDHKYSTTPTAHHLGVGFSYKI
jgi:opacity protein-like surface antigen